MRFSWISHCSWPCKKNQKVISLDIIEDEKISSISEFHKINVLDKENLYKLIKKADVIHHNAALVPLSKAEKKFYETNVVGTKNIVELALKSNNITHISHMSSSAIFGKPNSEKSNVDYMNYNPTGSYGISKYHAEMQMVSNKKTILIFSKVVIIASLQKDKEIKCNSNIILASNHMGIISIFFS